MFKITRREYIHYKGVWVQNIHEFDDDLVVKGKSVDEIVQKIMPHVSNNGILEIYKINELNQEVIPHKIIKVYHQLEPLYS